MFDVSFVELIVIGLVALLVLGPERLPRAARMLGLYLRKARAMWYLVRSQFEQELAAEDLRRLQGQVQQEAASAGQGRSDSNPAGNPAASGRPSSGEIALHEGEAVAAEDGPPEEAPWIPTEPPFEPHEPWAQADQSLPTERPDAGPGQD